MRSMGETRGGESLKADVTVTCGVNDKHGKRVPRVYWLKIAGVLVGSRGKSVRNPNPHKGFEASR